MRMREGQKVRRNKNLASRHGGEFECSRRVFNLNDVNANFFVHGSKFQCIDGINLNLTHVCVCCEIIFVFTYIALVVFVYKVKKKIIQ